MLRLFRHLDQGLLIGSALAVAALAGWGSFAYSAATSSRVTAERHAAVANFQQLQETAGQLAQLESKLGSARFEYTRVVQAWADTRGKLGTTQQELAQLTKRLDQVKDRASQTGSIKPADPSRRPARN
jgi:septal ring factor EnvC (AmiA/AmiB activator)